MKTRVKSNSSNLKTNSDATRHNLKSGSKVAAYCRGPSSPSWAGRWSNLGADHAKRWEKRLYPAKSGGVELGKLAVRIQHLGKREEFRFDTTNRAAAAIEAKGIYTFLKANGWKATLAKFKPAGEAKSTTTVGDFLAEVQRTANLKPRTFARYAQYLRMIVAHIAGLNDKHRARYDYRTGGRKAWLAKVDAVHLDKLTPKAAADWKADYLGRADDDPLSQVRNKRSFNAALRSAKSLFQRDIINADNFAITVPRFAAGNAQHADRQILWFENLKFATGVGDMKFKAQEGITAETLIMAARNELHKQHPDAYLLLLLCLAVGLRRAEADVLLWDQIHYGRKPADCYIQITTTEFIQPKHDSGGKIYVEAEMIKHLLSFKAGSQSPFVVSSVREWRRATTYHRYRCEPHWQFLLKWLRGKGINDRTPNHTLRKMFGDAITKSKGIYAAKAQLRHKTVAMTVNHYADPTQQAPLEVAHLISDQPLAVTTSEKEAVAELVERLRELSPAAQRAVSNALNPLAAVA